MGAVTSRKKLKGSGKAQRIAAAPLKTARWQVGLNRNELFCLGLVLAATFVAYFPVLKAQFTNYDDNNQILESHLVRNLSFENIKDALDQSIGAIG